jgi:hypothetical protein
MATRDFIAADNQSAARHFLDAAFEAFNRLATITKQRVMGFPGSRRVL